MRTSTVFHSNLDVINLNHLLISLYVFNDYLLLINKQCQVNQISEFCLEEAREILRYTKDWVFPTLAKGKI